MKMNKTAATVAVVAVIAFAGYAFLRGDAVRNALPTAEAETVAAPAVDLTPENSLTTISGEKIALESLAHYDADADSTVYFLSEISPDSLVKIYEALEWKPEGKLGVKISTGESMKTNHLRPELIGKLVKQLDGTIVECNTAYGGNRMETAKHWQTIKEHGYLDMAPCDILDEEGSMTLKVDGYARIPENYVGTHFKNYDSYLVLSHFKGHQMGGFGGAPKNISIGFGSTMGKNNIHTGGKSKSTWLGGVQDEFTESMADAAKSVHTAMNGHIVYISVMNRLSIDCDCNGNPAEPEMGDVGILASANPVALDQACVDLVYASKDNTASLRNRMEKQNAVHILETAEKINLGKRAYKLVDLDD